MKQDVLLTKEGLSELTKEHEVLVNNKRPALVDRIKKAREKGDLSENSDYTNAREELAFIDGRIDELAEILQRAKVIRASKKSKNQVSVGSIVTLHIKGKEEVFTVVGEWEAKPAEKKISHSSPLGKALLGKKTGEEIEVEAPAGRVKYKILSIE